MNEKYHFSISSLHYGLVGIIIDDFVTYLKNWLMFNCEKFSPMTVGKSIRQSRDCSLNCFNESLKSNIMS